MIEFDGNYNYANKISITVTPVVNPEYIEMLWQGGEDYEGVQNDNLNEPDLVQSVHIVSQSDYAPEGNEVPLFKINEEYEDEPELNFTINFTMQWEDTIGQPGQISLDIPFSYSNCVASGDTNGDGFVNVLDLVTLYNCILAVNCTEHPYACAMDLNSDGEYNVLDIVSLANYILSQG